MLRIVWGCGFDAWPCSVHEGSSVATSYGEGSKCSSDPTLLWLWHRPAATDTIQLLAWELPYATDAVVKIKKNFKMIWMRKSCRMIMSKEGKTNRCYQAWKGTYSADTYIPRNTCSVFYGGYCIPREDNGLHLNLLAECLKTTCGWITWQLIILGLSIGFLSCQITLQ